MDSLGLIEGRPTDEVVEDSLAWLACWREIHATAVIQVAKLDRKVGSHEAIASAFGPFDQQHAARREQVPQAQLV
jgi:hypothetical protein